MDDFDQPANPPYDGSQLESNNGRLKQNSKALDHNGDPEQRQCCPSNTFIRNPMESVMRYRRQSRPNLQNSHDDRAEKKDDKTEPVLWRAPWKASNRVSFGLASEFVAVQGDDEEIADVFSDRLAIGPPQRRHSVQEDGQGVHAKVVETLISIPIALFQGYDMRQLRTR
jgi:hypothetical protein